MATASNVNGNVEDYSGEYPQLVAFACSKRAEDGLKKIADEFGVSRSEVMREALRNHLIREEVEKDNFSKGDLFEINA